MTSLLYCTFEVCQALIFDFFVFFCKLQNNGVLLGKLVALLDVNAAADSAGRGKTLGVLGALVFGECNSHFFFQIRSDLLSTLYVERNGYEVSSVDCRKWCFYAHHGFAT